MENNNLRRQLSPMHVWAIAFGCVIGWGSFINPGKKFLPNSGVAGTAIAMVLGALVMIVIAFSYAYMVPKYPSAGGEFSFAKNCFGKKTAFLCGWFLVVAYLTNVPMNSTAIGLIVDGLDGTADCLKFGFHYSIAGFEIYAGEMLLSMLILVLFGWLNVIGVKKAGIVQTVLSSLCCVSPLCSVPRQRGSTWSRSGASIKPRPLPPAPAPRKSGPMPIREAPELRAPSSPPLPLPPGPTSASMPSLRQQRNLTSASGKSVSS